MSARVVWLGPPGSGKTTRLLEDHIAPRVREFRDDFRLIVPTSTMAEHVRNTLARSGLTVRSNTILTVAAHATELAPDARVLDATIVESRLTELLAERCPAIFADAAAQPGFAPRLAAAIEELAHSGCDAYSWQAHLSLMAGHHTVADALGELWVELQRRLSDAGWITRHAWLQSAAHALDAGALAHVTHFYWDGFARLAAAELDLIRAQSRRGDVIVALPAWTGAARSGLVQLRRERFHIERFSPVRATPTRTLLTAATIEDEATAIAHRLRADLAAGAEWHDIAIVVRSHDPYVPLLTAACQRFGIPLRPYFAASVEAHPVARFFHSVLDAVLSEWNWEPLLSTLLSPVSRAGACPALPQFDYLLREKLPGSGLDEPRKWAAALPDSDALVDSLDRLSALTSWRDELATPHEWCERLTVLPTLLAQPAPASLSIPDALMQWRTRAAATTAWLDAIRTAADLLAPESVVGRTPGSAADPLVGQSDATVGRSSSSAPELQLRQQHSAADQSPISLAALLDAAKPFLREASLRTQERARDAVRLIDAQEARQWELPIVYVCGVLEGQFPRIASPDPILSEDLRARLRRHLTLRTRSERDAEERFLFDVALTRATHRLTLSYPRSDAKGEPTLPAFALSTLFADATLESAAPCDLAPPLPSRDQEFLSRDLPLQSRDRKGAGWSPTSQDAERPTFTPSKLETYLECPFAYFAEHTLQLKEPPVAPAERFDGRARGSLVHHLLAQYHRLGTNLLQLFEAEWSRVQRKLRVPPSYRLEVERALLERSLRMYSATTPVGEPSAQNIESSFELDSAGAVIKGRIDRFETNGRDCIVYDYKFSRPSGVAALKRDEDHDRGLQAGLYLEALMRESLNPLAFYYVALKGACASYGWTEPADLARLAASATTRAAQAITEILAGRIDVAPIDPESCTFCTFKDACRISEIGYAKPQAAAE